MKRINASPSPKKVEYFLRSMAGFECLFYFFKKNKVISCVCRFQSNPINI
jgi:hypothetical protein